MSELSAHEVLVNARNLQDREEWYSQTESPGGSVCAIIALVAAGRSREADEVFAGVVGVQHRGLIPGWNNAPGRTKAEVLAAFDKAISATAPAPVDPLEGVEMAEVVA